MIRDYLDSLNDRQCEAVVHSDANEPLLILAGAGSGKTRVITTKIAFLIQERGINPSQILAVTFTKKAANEMKERAVNLEPRAAGAQIRTFHSFGAWFLRRYADEAGLTPSFTVYDDADSATLIAKAVPAMKKRDSSIAAHKIALAKDFCLSPDDDLSEIDSREDFPEIYRAYQNRLRATGNADFGDLIMLPVRVMEQNPQIRAQMRRRFRVIMVDEYQDSNIAQFKLLQMLAGLDESSGAYVCVVGDDDQSIYRFRGAEVQNILNFADVFAGTKIIKLESNYRSTAKILAAADAVVKHNTGRLGKTLIAERGDGSMPQLFFLKNQDEEAAFAANLIEQSHNDAENPCPYGNWAVLYRTNAQSLAFETEFLHRKIPYVVVGSLKFYEREEIKDTLAYLAFIANPRDEIAFRRIVNKPPRGVGDKSQEKLIDSVREKGARGGFTLLNACEDFSEGLSKKARDGAKEFAGLVKNAASRLHDEETAERLSVFVQGVIEESRLLEYHQGQDEIDGTSRAANMQELVNAALMYPCTEDGLLEFLDSIELDRVLAEDVGAAADAVTLITLHNTKGLEFPRVIITGLENGIFPRADKYGAELEEERRLFYVGITRAKDELFITSCLERRLFGRTEAMMPSQFLLEAGNAFQAAGRIPDFLRGHGGAPELDDERAALVKNWARGTRVFHDDYGYGEIINCDAKNAEVVITVRFETGASKKFLPKYQARRLDIIGNL
ncbi:MAG: ATP-dependent helicase [Treponema sp.]